MATPSAPRVDVELAQKIEVVVTEPSMTPPPAATVELEASEKTPEPVARPVPPSVQAPIASIASIASGVAIAAVATLDDVAVSDEVAVSFFSAPPVTHAVVHVEEVAAPDPATERRRRASTETAIARRRALARYVTGAVAVSFMICAAAAVRAATVNRDEPTAARPTYQAAAARPQPVEVPAVAPAEPAIPAAAAEAPAAAPEPAKPTPATEPAVEPQPKAAAQGVDEKTPAAAAPAEAPSPEALADAREAKRAAQRALDRGDAAKAIEAAKRSVEGDPSDAETWLILGAAYQARGQYAEGRESFASCTKQATRGPKGECRALLR